MLIKIKIVYILGILEVLIKRARLQLVARGSGAWYIENSV